MATYLISSGPCGSSLEFRVSGGPSSSFSIYGGCLSWWAAHDGGRLLSRIARRRPTSGVSRRCVGLVFGYGGCASPHGIRAFVGSSGAAHGGLSWGFRAVGGSSGAVYGGLSGMLPLVGVDTSGPHASSVARYQSLHSVPGYFPPTPHQAVAPPCCPNTVEEVFIDSSPSRSRRSSGLLVVS